MEDQPFVGELVAGIAYLTAGVRMLRLSQRTGEAPERLLGVAFALMGTSYLFYMTPVVFGSESLSIPLTFAGRIAFDVGIVPFALFTRTVFRSDESWATWIVCGCAVLIAVGVTCSLLAGDAEGMTLSNGWFWLEWVGYTIPSVWMSVEAFLAYAGAKKRARIGLSDALVANRFLLWAFHGLFGVAACLTVILLYSGYAEARALTAVADRLLGCMEMGSVVTLWLVFFPPARYRNWITRDTASVTAAER
jgi:hypothetical protein